MEGGVREGETGRLPLLAPEFPDSSAVEQGAVNAKVAGSNPAPGAMIDKNR